MKNKSVFVLSTLIHYGAKSYNRKLVKPILNSRGIKPRGGLWTSPMNSSWGWKDWCNSEEFRDCEEENSFKLRLNKDAKIFIINNFQDLNKASLITFHCELTGCFDRFLNFELLAKIYDAIWLTEKGQNETRFSDSVNLYGWDCECVFIMNPECCYEMKR